MGAQQGRQLASKLAKTAALLTHPRIASHIPQTRMFTRSNLKRMLNEHETVVIKPVRGSGGHGVMMINSEEKGYSCKHHAIRERYGSFDSLAHALRRKRRGRRYLIQKGIKLAAIAGRPIDYRVKVVKERGRWELRAMVGRLARRGLFITNLCRGGDLLSSAQGIARSLSPRIVRRKKKEMRSLTTAAVSVLERRFPGIGQLGFDYGIDRSGRIWIFEVNTRPH